jgi:hypothetical protein
MVDHDPELAAAIALSLATERAGHSVTTPIQTSEASAQATRSKVVVGDAGPRSTTANLAAEPQVVGLERFVGRFTRKVPIEENAWHSGTLSLSIQMRLRWDNDAGVGWSLNPSGGRGAVGIATPDCLITGETNPYVETQPAFNNLAFGCRGTLDAFTFGDDRFTRDEGASSGGVGAGGAMGGRQVEMDHAVALLSTNPIDEIRATTKTLLKLICNVAAHPELEKYRTIKKSNAKIAAVMRVAGATEFLRACGFRDSVDALTMAPHAAVPGALAGAQHALAKVGTNAEAGIRGHTIVPDGHFRCSGCRRVICNDDTIDFSGGGGMHIPQGDFKYKCKDCDHDYELCRKCFDSFQEGILPHDTTHGFEHVAPKTSAWGWGRGVPPPPPPPNSRNAGGAFR